MVVADTLRTLCKNRKGCGTRKGRVKGKGNCGVNHRSGIIPFRYTPKGDQCEGCATRQTLNLYAMVGDNPESFADLDGHANYSQSNAQPGACTDSPNTRMWCADRAAKRRSAKRRNRTESDGAKSVAKSNRTVTDIQ
jgi:hypothetical protein